MTAVVVHTRAGPPCYFGRCGFSLVKRLRNLFDAAFELAEKRSQPALQQPFVLTAAPAGAGTTIGPPKQVRVYRSLDTIKRRKLMGPERVDALAECTGGRPILIG